MYSVCVSIYYIIYCTLYTVQCIVYSVQCILSLYIFLVITRPTYTTYCITLYNKLKHQQVFNISYLLNSSPNPNHCSTMDPHGSSNHAPLLHPGIHMHSGLEITRGLPDHFRSLDCNSTNVGRGHIKYIFNTVGKRIYYIL